MMDLKVWLGEQSLSVREFAQEIDVPLKTAQDWVYRGVAPSAENQDRLTGFIYSRCAHHWVIDAANGHTSRGVCKRCEQVCPVGAINVNGQIDMNECIYCLDCQVMYYDDHQCPPLVARRKRTEQAAAVGTNFEFPKT